MGGRLRPEYALLPLVGWERQPSHPVLSTSAAYETAFEEIVRRYHAR